ncbi:hypothetical protein A2962_03190 [Candidatus Woesebacteria bacterium RIFCSPLOWO2_01_FULL_39_61]|uniref:Glycosyltransferase 2-like domain-containing protein n=1 Tax=Candidatus Woesebacteria bacterium RIFCSPHIGHO2_02_FULL_39_13 TaxID=1802505 RepID=A0A1F7Z4K2_9BACT|nr:MAG: hypothetical protein A2692_04275 [Candidatus Woesebacteria bacterium RIFCSPHIGHO2_01_FULL_39_95]OGM33828.1 MAG: hypothetical protein A3D01_02560 [Candidatus Woesebacteria bacterium RIFCSPHIGHO2_02_FULL_39_13]OGM38989.1 MAG: hypothetical protein A3E13_04830 [Candidatus Woesebacteria bacterium RIFCSPHIGHO2_12_FULL_40_20]OGM67494.1 MAG: hypothetical protein A2962_03190 [Candidatus Woesebacteria bacterium RIFCSPLOWO2_01_FULL_39_61]OGM72825.1 MAG: hypothetical protein A3H19_05695 [Candidatus
MRKKLTVTIGIPAYNEEANIGKLLRALLAQKQGNFVLKKIIVVSDGGTDKTDNIVTSFNGRLVKLLRNTKRIGQPNVQNLITKKVNTDVLVLINADVLPRNKNFLAEIIRPFYLDSKVGIVGADTLSTKPRTFFEKIIITAREFKKSVYKEINYGSNVYLCHGRARALSKKLYKKIDWPDDCAEDAYSYFYSLTNGFRFKFSSEAAVIFRSPSDLSGHKRQHDRFLEGKNNLILHFDEDLLKQEYQIPSYLFMQQFLINLVSNPFSLILYSVITLFLEISRLINNSVDKKINYSLWQVSASSKKL